MDDSVARIVFVFFVNVGRKFVVGCQEREPEQPLCFSGEVTSAKCHRLLRIYVMMIIQYDSYFDQVTRK